MLFQEEAIKAFLLKAQFNLELQHLHIYCLKHLLLQQPFIHLIPLYKLRKTIYKRERIFWALILEAVLKDLHYPTLKNLLWMAHRPFQPPWLECRNLSKLKTFRIVLQQYRLDWKITVVQLALRSIQYLKGLALFKPTPLKEKL